MTNKTAVLSHVTLWQKSNAEADCETANPTKNRRRSLSFSVSGYVELQGSERTFQICGEACRLLWKVLEDKRLYKVRADSDSREKKGDREIQRDR